MEGSRLGGGLTESGFIEGQNVAMITSSESASTVGGIFESIASGG
jgi:hypothetical protein